MAFTYTREKNRRVIVNRRLNPRGAKQERPNERTYRNIIKRMSKINKDKSYEKSADDKLGYEDMLIAAVAKQKIH